LAAVQFEVDEEIQLFFRENATCHAAVEKVAEFGEPLKKEVSVERMHIFLQLVHQRCAAGFAAGPPKDMALDLARNDKGKVGIPFANVVRPREFHEEAQGFLRDVLRRQ